MKKNPEQVSLEPHRIQAFAVFFKRYMGISSMIVAALPIPTTSFNLIPTFKFQTTYLSVYTSLFCFLALGFIFYVRHKLARYIFYERTARSRRQLLVSQLISKFLLILPLLLIMASLVCVYGYHTLLNSAITRILSEGKYGGRAGMTFTESVLTNYSDPSIPEAPFLMAFYLGIFVTAEAAFIMMAVKEYLQDILKVGEVEAIERNL